MKSKIADTRRVVDNLWSSHLQADQRSTAADVFFAQALVTDSNHQSSFLLEQAAYQLRGAVLSMWAASGESVPDNPPKWIVEAQHLLLEGDTNGYVELKSEINRLRLLSQKHINGQANDIRTVETRIESVEARESWIYLAYVFFNLFGLMVTMCKDIPVWKTERYEKPPA